MLVAQNRPGVPGSRETARMPPANGRLPLADYRVLDLTDEAGHFCGKILSDLGCDVIKVEPPGGDAARKRGPFFEHGGAPPMSLPWLAYNTGKRGITLRLSTAPGRRLLDDLAAQADFLIESFAPREAEDLGLRYEDLVKANPALIMGSISPFGDAGPYRDFKGGDLIGQASGGILWLSGTDARFPPARLGLDLAWHMASAQAAVGLLIAHRHRLRTGQGQRVELSIQEAVADVLYKAPLVWDVNGVIDARVPVPGGGGVQRRTGLWPCKDGYVSFTWWVGRGWGKKNTPLFQWMAEHGEAQDFLELDWEDMSITAMDQALVDRLEAAVGGFFARFTKAELYRESVRRRNMLYPVNSPRDIVEDPQLAARLLGRPAAPGAGALADVPRRVLQEHGLLAGATDARAGRGRAQPRGLSRVAGPVRAGARDAQGARDGLGRP